MVLIFLLLSGFILVRIWIMHHSWDTTFEEMYSFMSIAWWFNLHQEARIYQCKPLLLIRTTMFSFVVRSTLWPSIWARFSTQDKMTKFNNHENGHGDDLRTKRYNVEIKFETNWNKILFLDNQSSWNITYFPSVCHPHSVFCELFKQLAARPEKTLA